MSKTKIIYPEEKYFKSFYEALKIVARERIYIEMIEPPAFERVAQFQRDLLSQNGPAYYAVQDEGVVGWCDAFPEDSPRLKHRANLGMGLLPDFRGKGLGSRFP